ncbi:MAG: hypothetical protein JXA54_03450 [Candidatus Heimdallarchaeota archaeon]|nr:hypothetical protein [Candidatus Heimdallarchaeota archaeon]
MNDDYYLPLLFSDKDTFAFVVIDDHLLFFAKFWGDECTFAPYCAFNSLLKLFNSPLKADVIPELFWDHFESSESTKDPSDVDDWTPCLIVETRYWYWGGVMCIHNDMQIDLQKEKPIILDNFKLLKQGFNFVDVVFGDADGSIGKEFTEEGLKLNKLLAKLKVELTSREAFILFGNICVSSFQEDPSNLRKTNVADTNERVQNLLVRLHIDHIFNTTQKYRDFKDIALFVSDYLDWLRNELQQGTIDPKTILRLNGFRVFSYLLDEEKVQQLFYETAKKMHNYQQLSRKELLLYFTFYARHIIIPSFFHRSCAIFQEL